MQDPPVAETYAPQPSVREIGLEAELFVFLLFFGDVRDLIELPAA